MSSVALGLGPDAVASPSASCPFVPILLGGLLLRHFLALAAACSWSFLVLFLDRAFAPSPPLPLQ